MSDATTASGPWIVWYTWPADDANPYNGPQAVHEDPAMGQADAEFRAEAWRQAQAAMGLGVNAKAVNLGAR
jgi:hypothetical protein